jgi:hypothetical protein
VAELQHPRLYRKHWRNNKDSCLVGRMGGYPVLA